MKLKQYQSDALATLRLFFEDARVAGPKAAYEKITAEPERAARLGRYGGTYEVLEGLPKAPYVCLRLPTGGGKTILASHSITIARDAWIEKDYPLVLWLVPTNTIRIQTAERDPREVRIRRSSSRSTRRWHPLSRSKVATVSATNPTRFVSTSRRTAILGEPAKGGRPVTSS